MKLSFTTSLLIAAAVLASVHAEIPLIPKERLEADSRHIAIGKVKLIATEDVNDGRFIHRVGVVEIQISEVEKGEKIESGDAVYARFWTQTWIGKGNPPPFGSGHRLPKKGDTVRVYLAEHEGGYDALLPNGFEVIPKPAETKAKEKSE